MPCLRVYNPDLITDSVNKRHILTILDNIIYYVKKIIFQYKKQKYTIQKLHLTYVRFVTNVQVYFVIRSAIFENCFC